MIKQFIKILLRNKTKNVLLLLQFSFSFIALYMLATRSVNIVNSFTTPLGFSPKHLIGGAISNVWGTETLEEFEYIHPKMKLAMEEIRELPFVQHAGYLTVYPYGNNNNNSNGNKVNYVTPEALKAIGLEQLSGRFFTHEDQFDSQIYKVILNKAAMEHYSSTRNIPDLHGKNLFQVWQSDDSVRVERTCTIIGSFDDFRIHGRFRRFDNERVAVFLTPFDNEDFYKTKNTEGQFRFAELGRSSRFVIRTDGSVPIAEAMRTANRVLKKHLPKNEITIHSVNQLHERSSEDSVQSFIILFFICAVLMFIITVGVIAITKENTSKRFKEVGIRMALGSTNKEIMKLFLFELGLLVLTASVLSGIVIYLLNEYRIASFQIGIYEYLLSIFILLAIAFSSVYRPIKKVSELKPNIALHYE